ncbi:TOTE conflict system archaeo-eukaryotic primase domain-containing protein [Prosthecobacter sp.]|uniref:TOTE conflict system archaeo-eukaryotic primase domain-containing protein n=1 Tax=Prosthecobacter sp. TaxID=1965333 RepID=UPI00378510BC
MPVTQTSPASVKIELFRSLFRGRTEVYPRRFESRKTGKSGYQPVCGNEWVRGVCEKPRIKCSECPHQRWLPVTDDVIRWHLSGMDDHGQPFVMGVYPMLLDEKCWFLAADFDGEDWAVDASAFLETCRRLKVSAALERSRSGNGGHVWVFFANAVPAVLARKLGAHVLTETMEGRPEMGFRSYDRFFPNQDTLPKGGFGNLIALPLQKGAREHGNSLFIDESFSPHADQWAFLNGIERLPASRLDQLVRSAEGRGRVINVRFAAPEEEPDTAPWMLSPSRRNDQIPQGPMPAKLELVLADQIYLPKQELSPSLRNALLRLAAFQNPEFYKAQAMRLPTYDKPRIIACAEEHAEHVGLPRGCLEEVLVLLNALKVEVSLRDERFIGHPIDVKFNGKLRNDQQRAGTALLRHDTGVLSATTAFGKTVIAAWLIAQRGKNTIVLVHRSQLLEQWVERLSHFLGLPSKEIGRWGGGKKKLTGLVDVALMQSLVRKGAVNDLIADYGHVIVDECHHLSAQSFELIARRAKAKFVTGLSATVTRKDGHHPIIFMQCGPIRHRVDAQQQAAERPFAHEVLVRPTGFLPQGEPDGDPRKEFQRLCDAVAKNDTRNRIICEEILRVVKAGRNPLVLTERTEHLEKLVDELRPEIPHVIVLQGGMGKKALRATLDQLNSISPDEGRVVVATGRFVGEGFDDPRLDTLFLTMPVSWRGTIAQYVGRLHRLYEGKRVVQVYDYADLDIPMLARMFDRRCAGYEAVGYSILLPASALPGWPAEVPLPVDAQWKQDYSASVRRLIRDGVDQPLALLFVHAARPASADAQGVERARSASEAFFYRRLESLGSTKGLFKLNGSLPIPFDDGSQMEVDFLCLNLRLVIEIDGMQHLSTPESWRRDRRKDALLQFHGFFILRFFADDLSKRLDEILDMVLRSLEHLRSGRDV